MVLIVGSEGKEEDLSGPGFLNEKKIPKLDQIACFFLPSLHLVHSAHVHAGGWLFILGSYLPDSLLSIVTRPYDSNTMGTLYHNIKEKQESSRWIPIFRLMAKRNLFIPEVTIRQIVTICHAGMNLL